MEDLALQDVLLPAISDRRDSRDWMVDHASWVVRLPRPEQQTFHGKASEEGLAWCLVWLLAPELGVGPFRA